MGVLIYLSRCPEESFPGWLVAVVVEGEGGGGLENRFKRFVMMILSFEYWFNIITVKLSLGIYG